MRTINQIRRANLQRIKDTHKTNKATAKVTGLDAGVVSHMLNKKPDGTYHRNIGAKVARRIEEKMHLASGWLDQDRSDEADMGDSTDIYGMKIIEDVLRRTSPKTTANIIKYAIDMSELESYREKEKS